MQADPRRRQERDLNLVGFLHAPEATVILSERVILRANLQAELLFGWSINEMEGQSILLLYPGRTDYEVVGEKARRAMQEARVYRDERFMRCKNGDVVWMAGSGAALEKHEPQRLAVWTYRPVTYSASPKSGLTPAELRVARYLVMGFTSKEIALTLGISHRTVEVHRANMIRKMNVRNSVDLVGRLLGEGGNAPTSETN